MASIVLSSLSRTGYICYESDYTWATAHDASSGTAAVLGSTFGVVSVADNAGEGGDECAIYRSFVAFDTSPLGIGVNIESAYLFLWGSAKYTYDEGSGAAIGAYLSSRTNLNSLPLSDYSKASTTLASTTISCSSLTRSTSVANDFELNATGLAEIDPEGYTQFAFREVTSDAANVRWTGYNDEFYFQFYNNILDGGSVRCPGLNVVYTPGANVTGSGQISFSGSALTEYASRSYSYISSGEISFSGNASTSSQKNTVARFRTITIDHTKVYSTNAMRLWVPFTDDTDLGEYAQLDGSDVYFTLPDGTFLPFECVYWSSNNVTASAGYWILLTSPSMTADTVINMWYGRTGITLQSRDLNLDILWNDFRLVSHLDDSAAPFLNSCNQDYSDASAYTTSTSAICYKGVTFAGSTYIEYPATLATSLTAYSIQAWVKLSAQGDKRIVSNEGLGNYNGSMSFLLNSDGKLCCIHNTPTSYVEYRSSTTAVATLTQWYKLEVTFAGSGADPLLYVNGSTIAGGYDSYYGYMPAPKPDPILPLRLGCIGDSLVYGFLNGSLDEVWLRNGVRSPGLIKTEYLNQVSPGTFLTTSAGTLAGFSPVDYAHTASGGIEFTGDAVIVNPDNVIYLGSGILELSSQAGFAWFTIPFNWVGQGGISFSGDAITQAPIKRWYDPSGEVTFNGDASWFINTADHRYTGTGEISISGNAPASSPYDFDTEGSAGILFDGVSESYYTADYTITSSGEIIFSGEASLSYIRDFKTTGSIVFSSLDISQGTFVNAGYISSGSICFTSVLSRLIQPATLVTQGLSCSWTITSAAANSPDELLAIGSWGYDVDPDNALIGSVATFADIGDIQSVLVGFSGYASDSLSVDFIPWFNGVTGTTIELTATQTQQLLESGIADQPLVPSKLTWSFLTTTVLHIIAPTEANCVYVDSFVWDVFYYAYQSFSRSLAPVTGSGSIAFTGSSATSFSRKSSTIGTNGLTFNGTATYAHPVTRSTYLATGRLLFAGTAESIGTASSYTISSGGIVFSSSVTPSWISSIIRVSGGLTLSGTASTSSVQRSARTGSGSVSFSGSSAASNSKAYSRTALGGIQLNGTGAKLIRKIYATVGTDSLLFSGQASLTRIRDVRMSGSLTFSGSSSCNYVKAVLSRGAITFGGSALASFFKRYQRSATGSIAFTGTCISSFYVESSRLALGSIQVTGTAIKSSRADSRLLASGSISFAGTASSRRTIYSIGSGSLTFSGSSSCNYVKAVLSRGAITFGGSALASFFKRYQRSATGSIAFTGTCISSFYVESSRLALGSIQVTGTAIKSSSARSVFQSSGQLTFTGSGITTYARYVCGIGGLLFTGSSLTLLVRLVRGDGGITFTGQATPATTAVSACIALGSIRLTGSSSTSWSRSYACTGSGSIAFSGSAKRFTVFTQLTAGQIAFSGVGRFVKLLNFIGRDSLSFTGSATIHSLPRWLLLSSGTIRLTGSDSTSSFAKNFTKTAVGLISILGSAEVLRLKSFSSLGSGSIAFGGSAKMLIDTSMTGSGSISLTNQGCCLFISNVIQVSGQLDFSGSSSTDFNRRFLSSAGGNITVSGQSSYGYSTMAKPEASGSISFSSLANQHSFCRSSIIGTSGVQISGGAGYIAHRSYAYSSHGSIAVTGSTLSVATRIYDSVWVGSIQFTGSASLAMDRRPISIDLMFLASQYGTIADTTSDYSKLTNVTCSESTFDAF